MNEEICCIIKENQQKMNGKMMTLTFFKLYTVHIKTRPIAFPYLHINLFKKRYISSVISYKYLNKLISLV